jgi:pantoate--beta-alanine ligase
MHVITIIEALQKALTPLRDQQLSIGFVPTMGALHPGHLSLLKKCLEGNDVSVVSIYVNPTQFNDPGDLKNYPRSLDEDLALLSSLGAHIVFAPNDQEMYPEPDLRQFDLGAMGRVMEGRQRPGHFNGVAQIITKLFDAVKPNRAYFGQKDFQQLAIIRKLTVDLHYPIEIIACPIIREPDGLAMSSRNQLLSPEHRKAAPLIYRSLKKVPDLILTTDVSNLKKNVIAQVNSNPLLYVEYFELVDSKTLASITSVSTGMSLTACIAVKTGGIRLIDNIDFIL